MKHLLSLFVMFFVLGACTSAPSSEAMSLLGTPLHAMPLEPDVESRHLANLHQAQQRVETSPDEVLAHIWYGRRLAYLGRYRDAIDAYTEAISFFPDEPRLYRHRGHRWLTLRKFDRAIADLEYAAELLEGVPDRVEPDGLPNALGVPTSTTNGNVYYHLGLARYLTKDYEAALEAYDHGWALATNPDMQVAVAYWRALTLMRLGRGDEVADALRSITPEMSIIENHAYHDLVLLFKGLRTPADVRGEGDTSDTRITNATAAYGLGAWHDMNGDHEAAMRIWREVIDGPAWPAFGYIAAEAEVARRR